MRGGRREFWHRQVSVDSLCLYRVGFGAMLCVEAISWLPHATELFSNQGFHLGPWARWAPAPAMAFLLNLVLVVATALVAVGRWTKPALAVAIVIWQFFCLVDGLMVYSIHMVAVMVMGILLLAPCDWRYSLEDWLRQRRGLPRRPATACGFALRLLQLEFAQVYFFTGLTKLSNPAWPTGEVFFQCLQSRWANPIGVWVSGWVPDLALRLIGIGTIMYELLGPFLLFSPRLRQWVIAYGVLFHLGIEATTSIGSLGRHFLWALLLLYPDPQTVANLASRWILRLRAGGLLSQRTPAARGTS